MSRSRELDDLLASLSPILRDGEYVFVTIPGGAYGAGRELGPLAAFAEDEGLTLVIPRERAATAGLPFTGVFRMITLGVRSDLGAVGLTAAVAAALTARGISANVLAAYFHDHVFIPSDRASEALHALEALSLESAQ
jgi:hypothetical protein